MAKEELYKQIANIFKGFASIEEDSEGWFRVLARGCVFPSEIAQLRELCYVSLIGFNLQHICLEVHCKYMEEYNENK